MNKLCFNIIFCLLNSVLFSNVYLKNEEVFKSQKNKKLSLLNLYSYIIKICLLLMAIIFPLIVINS